MKSNDGKKMNDKTKKIQDFVELISKLPEKERKPLSYARARWEFLRRNKEFIKDIEKFHEDFENFVDNDGESFAHYRDDLEDKWKIVSPIGLLPQNSFEEVADLLVTEEYLKNHYHLDGNGEDLEEAETDLFCPISYSSPLVKMDENLYIDDDTTPDGVVDPLSDYDKENEKEFKKNGLLTITVNLNFSKKQLVDSFKTMIEDLQPEIYKREVKITRKHHRFDLYPLYLKVYDMKEKEKMTYKAIAQKFISEGIFIDDLEKDPRGPEIKVIQYYKEAKRIIDNIEDF